MKKSRGIKFDEMSFVAVFLRTGREPVHNEGKKKSEMYSLLMNRFMTLYRTLFSRRRNL